MRDPANWSTNEIEQRYSPELLKEVKKSTLKYEGEVIGQLDNSLLLHPPNPIVYPVFFGRCHDIAEQVRENMAAQTVPFIEEDILFLRFGRAVGHSLSQLIMRGTGNE